MTDRTHDGDAPRLASPQALAPRIERTLDHTSIAAPASLSRLPPQRRCGDCGSPGW